MIERIDTVLGHPSRDPHGDPIPDASGRISFPHTVPLSQCEPGETVVLERINDSDPKLLRYLSEHGFTPGAHLAIEEGAPFSEAINVRVVAPADAGAASAQTPAAPPQTTVPLGQLPQPTFSSLAPKNRPTMRVCYPCVTVPCCARWAARIRPSTP